MNLLTLRELDQLVAQRRTATGKKWTNSFAVWDIYLQLMDGKQLENDFHIHPRYTEDGNSLGERSWTTYPNLVWVEQTNSWHFLLTRRGWNKIWRDRLKFYRRGFRHKNPKWKTDKEAEAEARWEARFKKAKDSGNYLSI